MCLEVSKIKGKRRPKLRKDKNGNYIGYKVFFKSHTTDLTSECQGNMNYLPQEQWLDEYNFRGLHNKTHKTLDFEKQRDYYPIGWHIFLTLSDTRMWWKKGASSYYTIRRVKFQQICAKGWQSGKAVVVAKKLFICKGDLK